MADIFYTILIVWVLWRIFGGSSKSHVYHHHVHEKTNEGEIKVSKMNEPESKYFTKEGEYVDFEDLPAGRQG